VVSAGETRADLHIFARPRGGRNASPTTILTYATAPMRAIAVDALTGTLIFSTMVAIEDVAGPINPHI